MKGWNSGNLQASGDALFTAYVLFVLYASQRSNSILTAKMGKACACNIYGFFLIGGLLFFKKADITLMFFNVFLILI